MSDPENRPVEPPVSPIREITQPFIDFARSPRALWGVNVSYLIEGFIYFGMVTYLVMYFLEYVGLDEIGAGWMVGVLTAGITLTQFAFGGLADRWGPRSALLIATLLLLVGRIFLSMAGTSGLPADGWGSTVFLASLAGILLIVLGYGMYQPACYGAVREITTPKTAAMGYAMLYALMNLGGWLPTFMGPMRHAVGINGAFWFYTILTAIMLVLTWAILSKKTMADAVAAARKARAAESESKPADEVPAKAAKPDEPFSLGRWLRNHPLADPRFAFFIFALIPVQTLFAHNWLTLPLYVERAYRGTVIGEYFEFAVNFNPLLIFILVPFVTALTRKSNVYTMMIAGTFIMAAPTFLLATGPTVWALAGYLLIMTLGEAMWQPRFLQYAAEIAPEGRTGAYIGVAQLPWFLTKVITSAYAGWFLMRYCPAEGEMNTEFMWFVYGAIAMISPVLLVLARGWVVKDFKTKA